MKEHSSLVPAALALAALLAACAPVTRPATSELATASAAAEAVETEATPPPIGTPEPAISPTPAPAGPLPDCAGRIVFVGRSDRGERDVLLIDADGSDPRALTDGGGRERDPVWSPDGQRVAFERHEGNSDLYVVGAGGGEPVRLTEMGSREFAPTWSPDGEQIVFASQSGHTTELYVVPVQGGEPYALTDSRAHKPDVAWSPDGSLLAFTMLDGMNQGDIYLTAAPDFRGVGPQNLTQHPANDCCAAWSPQGGRLLFLSSREGGESAAVAGGSAGRDRLNVDGDGPRAVTTVVPEATTGLYLVETDGDGLMRLTGERGRVWHPAWSPDGHRIAFVSDRDGSQDVYVVTVPDAAGAGGGELRRLTESADRDAYPAWSPDGACVAFLTYRGSHPALNVVAAGGGGVLTLADDVEFGSAPDWAP